MKIPSTLFTDRMSESVNVTDVTKGAGVAEAAKSQFFGDMASLATDYNNKLVTARGNLLAEKTDIEFLNMDKQLREELRVKADREGFVKDEVIEMGENQTPVKRPVEVNFNGKAYKGRGRGMNEVYSEIMQGWLAEKSKEAPDQYAQTQIQARVGKNLMMSEVDMNVRTKAQQVQYQTELLTDIEQENLKTLADPTLPLEMVREKRMKYVDLLTKVNGSLLSQQETNEKIKNFASQSMSTYIRALTEDPNTPTSKIVEAKNWVTSNRGMTEVDIQDIENKSAVEVDGDYAELNKDKVFKLGDKWYQKKTFLGDYDPETGRFERQVPQMTDELSTFVDSKFRQDMLVELNKKLIKVEYQKIKEVLQYGDDVIETSFSGGVPKQELINKMGEIVNIPPEMVGPGHRQKILKQLLVGYVLPDGLDELKRMNTVDVGQFTESLNTRIKDAENEFAKIFPKNALDFKSSTVNAQVLNPIYKQIGLMHQANNEAFKKDPVAYVRGAYPEIRAALDKYEGVNTPQGNIEFQKALAQMATTITDRNDGNPLRVKYLDGMRAGIYANVISEAGTDSSKAVTVFNQIQNKYGPFAPQAWKDMIDVKTKGAEGVEADKNFARFYPAVHMSTPKLREDFLKTIANEEAIIKSFENRIVDGEVRKEIDSNIQEALNDFYKSSQNSVFEDDAVKDAYSNYVKLKAYKTLKSDINSSTAVKKWFGTSPIEDTMNQIINSNFEKLNDGQFIQKNLRLNKNHIETFMDATSTYEKSFDKFDIMVPANMGTSGALQGKTPEEKKQIFYKGLAENSSWSINGKNAILTTKDKITNEIYYVPNKKGQPVVIDVSKLTTDQKLNEILNWGYSGDGSGVKVKWKMWDPNQNQGNKQ